MDALNEMPSQNMETCASTKQTDGHQQNDDVENDDQIEYETKISNQYTIEKSSSSFQMDDLEGFVYGPITSRFWMLRKLIQNMEKAKLLEGAPFYAWECITL